MSAEITTLPSGSHRRVAATDCTAPLQHWVRGRRDDAVAAWCAALVRLQTAMQRLAESMQQYRSNR